MAEIRWEELFRLSGPILQLMIDSRHGFFFLSFAWSCDRDHRNNGPAVRRCNCGCSTKRDGRRVQSITDGFILIVTFAVWNVFLDWLNFKFPSMRRVIEAPPLDDVSYSITSVGSC